LKSDNIDNLVKESLISSIKKPVKIVGMPKDVIDASTRYSKKRNSQKKEEQKSSFYESASLMT